MTLKKILILFCLGVSAVMKAQTDYYDKIKSTYDSLRSEEKHDSVLVTNTNAKSAVVNENSQNLLDSCTLELPVGHSFGIQAIDFSYDGEYIATAGGYSIKIWHRKSVKEVKTFHFQNEINSIYFLQDNFSLKKNNLLVTEQKNNEDNISVFLLNIATGEKIYFQNDVKKYFFNISQCRNFCLTISEVGNEINIWDTGNGELLKVFKSNSIEFSSAIFNHTGKKIICVANTNKILVWDISMGEIVQQFIGHSDRIVNLEISKNDLYLISSSFDDTARLWDMLKGELIKIYSIAGSYLSPASFIKNDEQLTINSMHDTTEVYDLKTLNLITKLEGQDGRFGPNPKYGYTILSRASFNNTHDSLIVWDISKTKIIGAFSIEINFTPVFSKDGNYLSWVSNSTEAHEIELSTGLFRNYKRRVIWVNDFSVSTNKNYVASVPSRSNSGEIGGDRNMQLWELKTGILKQLFTSNYLFSSSAYFNSDDKYLISGTWGNKALVWEVTSGKELNSVSGNYDEITEARFSKNDKYIITHEGNFHSVGITYASIYHAENMAEPKFLKKYKNSCKSISINKDGNKIILVIYDLIKMEESFFEEVIDRIEIGSLAQGDFKKEFEIKTKNIYSSDFMNDENKMYVHSEFGIDVYSLKSYKKIYSIPINNVRDFFISQSKAFWFITQYEKSGIRRFEIETGKELNPIMDTFEQNNLIINSHDSESLISAIDENTLIRWDTKKDSEISRFSNTATFLDLYSVPEAKILITTDINLKTTVWQSDVGKPIYDRYILENNNWLVKLRNSPFYMCSRDASKMLHYVTPSLKVIGFEQLDPVYNRPDIVLDSIGSYFGEADRELVANYRQAWEKRIERLGLDKEKLGKGEIAVPKAEIVNTDKIDYENDSGALQIRVNASDPKYKLKRFNVYINEVPLYGSLGISINHLENQNWDTTLTVALSVGKNKVQVSVMNELGLENFKYPTYVNYKPNQTIASRTYFIGIGVNEFKEDSYNLKYCVKDVRDLAKALSVGHSSIDTLIFTDSQVIKENILALKEYLKGTDVNDNVIISCSSHGLLDDSLNFYLAMHDVDFKYPKTRGLKYEDLEDLLDGIPARKKLLLLDACNSGENDRTDFLRMKLAQAEKQHETEDLVEFKNKTRGEIRQVLAENQSNFNKMNELFVNVRNTTGAVIIAAAGGMENALEAIEIDGKTIENGAFTHSILECLDKNQGQGLTVNALKKYAEKRVEEITGGLQKPTSRQETMEFDWVVNEKP